MLTLNQRRLFQKKFLKLEAEASLAEPVVFSWLQPSEQPPTGCWSFQSGNHVIRVNINCADKSVATRSSRSASTFAEQIARHEFCHAKLTDRDFEKHNDMCKRLNCSFRLFNLFEDARIEREKRNTSGKCFRWLRWEKPATPKCPTSLFFAFIQQELDARSIYNDPSLYSHHVSYCMSVCNNRSKRALKKLGLSAVPAISRDTFSLVYTFFAQVTSTRTTADLEVLLAKWMELFPQTNEQGNGIAQVVEGSHCGDQIAPETISHDNVPPSAPLLSGSPSDATGKTKSDHIRANLCPTEAQEGANIANLLARAFRVRGEDKCKSLSASKRLNVRDIAVGNITRPYIKRTQQTTGIPKVAVIVDFSGSMSGEPSRNARVLLFALNRLARSETIKCHAFATRHGGCYTEQSMPCAEGKLNWQAVGGTEGMNTFFSQKLDALQEFDQVLVFTDGAISDRGTNFAPLHGRGIFPVGAYVANLPPNVLLTQQQVLSKYFDKGIARPDMISLASDLARLITR
jgi:hypothetical protein